VVDGSSRESDVVKHILRRFDSSKSDLSSYPDITKSSVISWSLEKRLVVCRRSFQNMKYGYPPPRKQAPTIIPTKKYTKSGPITLKIG
jgi:hypothetical protein